MSYIAPYITFNGNCREAMTFYKDSIGGELAITTMAEAPGGDKAPPEEKKKIMHAALRKDAIILMASDNMGGGPEKHGNNVNIMYNCDSEAEIKRLFPKLSAGGKVHHPLKEEFWGSVFGDFTDKFGMRWMLNWDKPKS